MFQKNEGAGDRWTRAIIGIAILGIAYFKLAGWIQIVGYVIGAILLITAITGFCGIYTLLGISTLGKKDNADEKTNYQSQ